MMQDTQKKLKTKQQKKTPNQNLLGVDAGDGERANLVFPGNAGRSCRSNEVERKQSPLMCLFI